jgi:hypothetical protein
MDTDEVIKGKLNGGSFNANGWDFFINHCVEFGMDSLSQYRITKIFAWSISLLCKIRINIMWKNPAFGYRAENAFWKDINDEF